MKNTLAGLAIENTALTAAGAYLKLKGYRVAVISVDRVQGPVGPRNNYELVFRFTGAIPAALREKGIESATFA